MQTIYNFQERNIDIMLKKYSKEEIRIICKQRLWIETITEPVT